MDEPLLWSLEEAARQLGGISTRTVRRMAQQGAFPLVRIGRRTLIPAAAVYVWVAHTQDARPASLKTGKAAEPLALTPQPSPNRSREFALAVLKIQPRANSR